MKHKIPPTPFSTPLSGSAKETKMRLEGIMRGPQKRPPLIFIVLVSAFCLLSGNLVSCNNAEAEAPNPPAVQEPEDSSAPAEIPENWTAVELDAGLLQYNGRIGDWFEEEYGPTEAERELLEHLPAAELPREAVDINEASKGDYWRDALLPVAYDEGADVTVYFVVNPDSTPKVDPLVCIPAWAPEQRGIVLRHGDRAEYFHLCWDGNAKYGGNPLLLVDDLDADGQPEAAVVLCLGGGTGAYEENLYLFDLDTMTYTLPDYSEVPLEISASPDGKTVRLASGEQELEVDVSELGDRFDGKMEVGNIVQFYQRDGRIFCHLDVDFTCDTLGYMAQTFFPVIYENNAYRLGPAELLTGDLLVEWP